MTESRDNVLELRGVTKRYGDFTAVDGIDLEVPAGSIYGFLGPNGAGKTTTLRMILEIIKPTAGTISVLGRPSALSVRRRIGYLPEEKGLYKKMKAWAIVAYFASLKGLSRRDAKARAHELLGRYGLGEFANARTEALSKGMGQKVQVLAAIAHDPDLVILDEPFSGLDPVNQQVMEQVIEDMASRGKTILFSTHVMQHAERICDKILLVASGRKVFDGSIEEAKRTMPPRIRLTTDDDVTSLLLLDGVLDGRAIQDDGVPPGTWDFTVEEWLDSQLLLQVCFESGIRLKNFDRSDPTLHDVFVHIVGSDAAEVRQR